MNEELQDTPTKSNKITIVVVALMIVVVLIITLVFLISSDGKDEVYKVYTQTYPLSDEQIELTQQQRTEKEEILKTLSDEQIELTEEQKQNKKALLEAISNQ